jgi:hypothetical protein
VKGSISQRTPRGSLQKEAPDRSAKGCFKKWKKSAIHGQWEPVCVPSSEGNNKADAGKEVDPYWSDRWRRNALEGVTLV